ncbi:uncharacterized protein LOC114744839 [Neltuma alba]|uniref:uncharacterized protein LOC114744839 n=1 Tax=Neltuma alba TaxID=207710 RepID=UPI0010A48722|nr:uncharacterized protein LOC114744839 [Prosopis alba]
MASHSSRYSNSILNRKNQKLRKYLLNYWQIKNLQGLATFSLHKTAIKNLEVQMGQLASQMNVLISNSLPSDTIPNPKRDNKECKAVNLRSGKVLPDSFGPGKVTKKAQNDVAIDLDKGEIGHEEPISEDDNKKRKQAKKDMVDVVKGKYVTFDVTEEKKRKTLTSPTKYVPLPPFPQRLKKQQEDGQFKKFLEMFKQLHVNIPLVEALEQMPKYAKFMKNVLTKKRRFTEYETIVVTKSFTDVIKQIPPKQKDSRSFSICCYTGNKFMGQALCDLGASVNLMPLSVFNKLEFGEARPTTITLQLAYQSMSYPQKIIEDVLVKVNIFIFSVDFIVLDFEADKEMPLLLGRPCLATARILIDVEKGELTLMVNDEHVTFNMYYLMKAPSRHEQCSFISIVDQIVQGDFNKSMSEDPLEAVLWGLEIDDTEVAEVLALMNASSSYSKGRAYFETLDLSSLERPTLKPSLEEPPTLELKTLPSHL